MALALKPFLVARPCFSSFTKPKLQAPTYSMIHGVSNIWFRGAAASIFWSLTIYLQTMCFFFSQSWLRTHFRVVDRDPAKPKSNQSHDPFGKEFFRRMNWFTGHFGLQQEETLPSERLPRLLGSTASPFSSLV
jgi:hypothetical protein